MKKIRKINDVSMDIFSLKENIDDFEVASQKEDFLGEYVNSKKIFYFIFLIVGILLVIFFRLFYLQMIKGKNYLAIAQGNSVRVEAIPAVRGLIYDSSMNALVNNNPNFIISITLSKLPRYKKDREKQINSIISFLDLDEVSFMEKIKSYPSNYRFPVELLKEIPYLKVISLQDEIYKYPSLSLELYSERYYKFSKEGFSHILGYTGKINQSEYNDLIKKGYLSNDIVGRDGIENEYEDILRGKNGSREIQIDAQGRKKEIVHEVNKENGKSIVLNIDQKFQSKVYSITKNYLYKIGKKNASVVVMNPNNGAVLSMVSFPEYDDNLFSKGIAQKDYDKYINDKSKPLLNRVIRGEYPSGSTIKLIVGAAALQEKVITDRTGFWSTGGLLVANKWFFPDWLAGGHGYTTIYKAIADSVNTFFYYIGGGYEDFDGLGLDRLIKYYHKFGLGEKTNIDLPNERTGLVPTREWKKKVKDEEWYIGDTYHMAIGQGDVLVTPLQVANYTSFFANGGKLYEPQIVDYILDDGIKKDIEPKLLNENIVSNKNVNIIKKAMRKAVLEGSARYLTLLPVTSAGKTGTAQFSKRKAPHAWFTGFAPYEKPEIVVTVLIEEGEEGSKTAVRLAEQIMSYYFNESSKKNSKD